MFNKLTIERTNLGCGNRRMILEGIPASHVDRCRHQTLVHRQCEMSIPANSRAIRKCSVNRLTQTDPDVLGGVMIIHVQIANCAQLQVDQRMLGKQIQHVIQKSDPRLACS